MPSKIESVRVEDAPTPPTVFETRAVARGVSFEANTATIHAILDHGYHIYSEQWLTLQGVLVDPEKERLAESFIMNWLAHAATPSTLWVLSLNPQCASFERDALDAWGKPSDTTDSLAADLVEQGLATWAQSDPDA